MLLLIIIIIFIINIIIIIIIINLTNLIVITFTTTHHHHQHRQTHLINLMTSSSLHRAHDATEAVQLRKKLYAVSEVGFLNSATNNAVKCVCARLCACCVC
jgi:hypothetical protein